MLEHRAFRDLPEYLQPSDTLVFNTTSVLPARLVGRRLDSGGAIGGLFLGERERGCWQVMLRSNGKLRAGIRIGLLDQAGAERAVIELLERADEGWLVALDGEASPVDVLGSVGRVPLPPYIDRARQTGGVGIENEADELWYQTVYADPSKSASVAAPTAGLHFTTELLDTLSSRGIGRADVVLHVGAGTFKPIDTDDLSNHAMHEEFFEIPAETAAGLASTRENGGRRIMVGTTAVRSSENLTPEVADAAQEQGLTGATDLFITPGYDFVQTDGLITNFHLPRSTLLALVGALLEADGRDGIDRLLAIYAEAIERGYRFFSYGDAMLILP